MQREGGRAILKYRSMGSEQDLRRRPWVSPKKPTKRHGKRE